jgi:hypothetical protein
MTVTGTPRLLVRLENLLFLGAALVAYHRLGASWLLFAALFLVPDLSFFGYLAGPRSGAAVYNVAHAYIGPAVLACLALAGLLPGAWPIALVWAAHVAFDRALGYGLKYPSAFRDTHLGTIGKENRV